MNVQAQLECISVLLKCVEDFKSTEQLKNTLVFKKKIYICGKFFLSNKCNIFIYDFRFLNLIVRSCKHFVSSETRKHFVTHNSLKIWNIIRSLLEIFNDVLLIPYS